jgi:ATP synthase protein I
MKNETKKQIRLVGLASTIGMSVVFSIFIGLAIGYWLDSKFGTLPLFSLVFLVMGVIAGFRNYYRFMKKQEKDG